MVTPVGSFSIPVFKLRNMVSLSATFQSATGGTQAAALNRITTKDKDIYNQQRPRAVIRIGDEHGSRMVAGGDRNYLLPFGSLTLYLTRDTPPELWDDEYNAEIDAANFFGSVHDDVIQLAGDASVGDFTGTGHLDIRSARLTDFDESPEKFWRTNGRFYWAMYMVEWGFGG